MVKSKALETLIKGTSKALKTTGKCITHPVSLGIGAANAFLTEQYVNSQNHLMPANMPLKDLGDFLSFPFKAAYNTAHFAVVNTYNTLKDLVTLDFNGLKDSAFNLAKYKDVMLDHIMNHDYIQLAETANELAVPAATLLLAGYTINRLTHGTKEELQHWNKVKVSKNTWKKRTDRITGKFKERAFKDIGMAVTAYSAALGATTSVIEFAKSKLNYLDYASTAVDVATTVGSIATGGVHAGIKLGAQALSWGIGYGKDITTGLLTNEIYQGLVHYIDKFPKEELNNIQTFASATALAGIISLIAYKATQDNNISNS